MSEMTTEDVLAAADAAVLAQAQEPAKRVTYEVQVEVSRPAVSIEGTGVKVEGHGLTILDGGEVVAHFRTYNYFKKV